MIKLVDLGKQHNSQLDELNGAIRGIVEKSAFIGGDAVKTFEESFAKFCGVFHAVGVSNGTSALEIALRANNISSGDEVITVANTFFATTEAILNVGAIPIYVDVSIVDGLMDLNLLGKLITKKTKAIIPVHLFGNLVNIKELLEISRAHNLVILEDAAQAHGANAVWGMPGHLSEGAAFSFYPGKNLGAWGDAGALVTNNNQLAASYSKIRDHGRVTKYEHDIIGMNGRMDAIQASILKVKLTKLQEWNLRRSVIADYYLDEFQSIGFKVLNDKLAYNSAWHLFVVRVKNRSTVQSAFKSSEIETGIHYPIPLHKQPAVKSMNKNVKLPITESLCDEIISVPIHPFLSDSDVERVSHLFSKIAEIA